MAVGVFQCLGVIFSVLDLVQVVVRKVIEIMAVGVFRFNARCVSLMTSRGGVSSHLR